MDLSSTIVALSSAPGRSARAVIRLSGATAFEALARLVVADTAAGGASAGGTGVPACASADDAQHASDRHRQAQPAASAPEGPRAVATGGASSPPTEAHSRNPSNGRATRAGAPEGRGERSIGASPDPFTRGVHSARLHLRAITADLPVLLVTLPAPRSYTGEGTVEILLPGSPALVDLVLEELLALPGVRAAEPGEFSARAHLNGRLSLEQAEGVAQRIAAESGAQLAAADRLLTGEAGQEEAAWAQQLARGLALVEAGVDFTDQEDVHPISAPDLRAQLEQLTAEIEARLGGGRAREAGDALPLVALVGRPNAGKSTLLNALVGRQRAVTSPQPGATRDALAETIDLSADAPLAGEVTIVDLPGLEALPAAGAATEAQRNLLGTLERADAIVLCDPSGRFDAADLPAAAEAMRATPVICARTMADLGGIALPPDAGGSSPLELPESPGSRDTPPPPHRPEGPCHIPICALDGFGLADLRRAIARTSGAGSRGGEALLLAPRRRRALAQARAGLAEALDALHEGPAPGSIASPEVVAAGMRAALDALGALSGHISPDEVLGEVFRSFCVGK